MSGWAYFGFGFMAGSILFDILWRILAALYIKLIDEQRKHINLLNELNKQLDQRP